MSGLVAFISLRPPNITLNNNFFTIGRSKIFQKKYFWKDIEIHKSKKRLGHFFLYIVNKNDSNGRKISLINDPKDFDEGAMEALAELLSFFQEHYAYVDIHSPEIDRPEVKELAEKLSRYDVTCEFSS